MTKQLTQPKFRPNFIYRLLLFDEEEGHFIEDRYYWTKWGLQEAMKKYRSSCKFILFSGHINWKCKLDEMKKENV